MSREERVALHTNQKRMQFSSEMPNEKTLVEGKPEYRETSKGLYQYVRFNNEVYSQLFTRHTRTLEEQINDTVNNITVNNLTVTDPLEVTEGGTGLTSITDGAVMLGSGTSAVNPLAVTTNGAILIGDGTTAPTTYSAFSGSAGTLNVGAGGTGQTSVTNFKNVLDDETWTFANAVTANAGVSIDNITIDGTEIDLSTGDLTFDVAGDIILDAAGDQIYLKDNTSTRFTFNLDSTPEIDVTGAFTIDGSSTITLDAATNIIGITGGRTVIKADTGGHIYFHDFDGTFTGGTALFNDYKINNLADNYHFVTGLADYKQNYALIAEEFSSAAYNLDFHK